MKIRRLAIAALLATAAACGDSDPTQPTAPNPTGTWVATVTVTGGTAAAPGAQFSATFVLVQTGPSDWDGTFSTQGGNTGTVSGGLTSDRSFAFDTFQAPPCAGTFSGVGTLGSTNQTMTGTYAGSDCSGTLQSTFTATKL